MQVSDSYLHIVYSLTQVYNLTDYALEGLLQFQMLTSFLCR